MVHTEVKEVIYVALGLFIVSLVLSTASFFIHLRDEMASTRNDQIQTTTIANMYREFNKYNDTIVYGEDVIEAIRAYFDTDVELYVDRIGGSGSSYYITKELVKTNKSLVDIKVLQGKFGPNQRYKAYLVFDNVDVRTAKVPMFNSQITHEVTGIKFVSY